MGCKQKTDIILLMEITLINKFVHTHKILTSDYLWQNDKIM